MSRYEDNDSEARSDSPLSTSSQSRWRAFVEDYEAAEQPTVDNFILVDQERQIDRTHYHLLDEFRLGGHYLEFFVTFYLWTAIRFAIITSLLLFILFFLSVLIIKYTEYDDALGKTLPATLSKLDVKYTDNDPTQYDTPKNDPNPILAFSELVGPDEVAMGFGLMSTKGVRYSDSDNESLIIADSIQGPALNITGSFATGISVSPFGTIIGVTRVSRESRSINFIRWKAPTTQPESTWSSETYNVTPISSLGNTTSRDGDSRSVLAFTSNEDGDILIVDNYNQSSFYWIEKGPKTYCDDFKHLKDYENLTFTNKTTLMPQYVQTYLQVKVKYDCLRTINKTRFTTSTMIPVVSMRRYNHTDFIDLAIPTDIQHTTPEVSPRIESRKLREIITGRGIIAQVTPTGALVSLTNGYDCRLMFFPWIEDGRESTSPASMNLAPSYHLSDSRMEESSISLLLSNHCARHAVVEARARSVQTGRLIKGKSIRNATIIILHHSNDNKVDVVQIPTSIYKKDSFLYLTERVYLEGPLQTISVIPNPYATTLCQGNGCQRKEWNGLEFLIIGYRRSDMSLIVYGLSFGPEGDISKGETRQVIELRLMRVITAPLFEVPLTVKSSEHLVTPLIISSFIQPLISGSFQRFHYFDYYASLTVIVGFIELSSGNSTHKYALNMLLSDPVASMSKWEAIGSCTNQHEDYEFLVPSQRNSPIIACLSNNETIEDQTIWITSVRWVGGFFLAGISTGGAKVMIGGKAMNEQTESLTSAFVWRRGSLELKKPSLKPGHYYGVSLENPTNVWEIGKVPQGTNIIPVFHADSETKLTLDWYLNLTK